MRRNSRNVKHFKNSSDNVKVSGARTYVGFRIDKIRIKNDPRNKAAALPPSMRFGLTEQDI
ncbi:hypothetical protein ATPR_2935 [Acetobacter tropicalis NBRC 101654]|uniref:Uncharacterized protein n=1 Tax=Acetobacter tropicalis NBRC 101654 TaxID=749388 RepID=F7VHT6_9PROT|nr:hypothetical protein ATPR_2935 [Acetobacter tropicalis NBRC 101654]